MTVLITGGAGYIGGQTAIALLDRGENPVILDDLSTGSRRAIPANVPFVFGDVGDVQLVRKTIKEHRIKAVFHFAAKIVVPESVAHPLLYYLHNTVKTRALLEASVGEGIRHFVFSSTAAVYGNPQLTPVNEDVAPAPLSPYGKSKWMSEQMLRDTSTAYPLQHVILRYFNVAGADPAGRHGQRATNATHLIKVALETALGRRAHINVYGDDYPTPDGTCIRDYVHVSDLADAHLAALEFLRRGGESNTFNCGYGKGYSVSEVIETVKSVTGVDFEVHRVSRRAGDPASIVASRDRLMRQLAWKPLFNDLATIVQHAYDWEKNHA